MRIIFYFLIGGLLLFSSSGIFAQNKEITFILLRHAEKDVSPKANKADVELSAEGKQRAKKLVKTIKNYQPDRIFSTVFKRTRDTVTPLAENLNPDYRMQIQFYDYAEIEEFAGQLLKLDAKTVVVAGHNTTTPELANLLIKQDKYKDLAETEYDKIWVIKIKRNKNKPHKIVEEKVFTY